MNLLPSNLTEREQRTVRTAAIGLALYLALFYGWRTWRQLEAGRAAYHQLLQQAQQLKLDLQRYETRALMARKFMEQFRLDPARQPRSSLVAQASAAIQRVATSGGIQFGPIRELPGRPSARELASMQLEGSGSTPAVMTFLHRLETLGFPLVLDTVQLRAEPARPGLLKVNLTVIILDFNAWKNEEAGNA
ncbi:MAG: hypothetical protein KGS61_06825 [Verrucomicrobia bacterium]|nr:hypothetical protein [Verrucomicrobiota bacterium]